MNVLVLNAGSSSLKGALIDSSNGKRFIEVLIDRIGERGGTLRVDEGAQQPAHCADHGAAVSRLLALFDRHTIAAAGHRVVHGGEHFADALLIDDSVERGISALEPLAPLHVPGSLAGIRRLRERAPGLPQVAVFDTAFHLSLPRAASTYALPHAVARDLRIRRYGFHGISHACVTRRAAIFLDRPGQQLNLISCHLGNGCSVAAVAGGRCVDTSMGMTPLEGLVMGTRCGDIDAGVLLYLMRAGGYGPDALDRLLNQESGLKGLSGIANDMREIEQRAAHGDDDCRFAMEVFVHRLRKYLGAYAAVLGHIDAILFTGGIGEHSATVREQATARLEFLGVVVERDENRSAHVDTVRPVVDIAAASSPVRVLVVATDEEGEIATETARIVRAGDSGACNG